MVISREQLLVWCDGAEYCFLYQSSWIIIGHIILVITVHQEHKQLDQKTSDFLEWFKGIVSVTARARGVSSGMIWSENFSIPSVFIIT